MYIRRNIAKRNIAKRNIATRTTTYEDEYIDDNYLYLDEAPVEGFDDVDSNNEEFLHEGVYIPEDYDYDDVNLPGRECDDEGNTIEPIFEDYIECNPYDSLPCDDEFDDFMDGIDEDW